MAGDGITTNVIATGVIRIPAQQNFVMIPVIRGGAVIDNGNLLLNTSGIKQ
ncbi:MAG TPA: hypothetical protein VK492_03060 [Chitinophagaceae bacterium]|nr:hypothetical protein [Chitinophagaceae bacterium]